MPNNNYQNCNTPTQYGRFINGTNRQPQQGMQVLMPQDIPNFNIRIAGKRGSTLENVSGSVLIQPSNKTITQDYTICLDGNIEGFQNLASVKALNTTTAISESNVVELSNGNKEITFNTVVPIRVNGVQAEKPLTISEGWNLRNANVSENEVPEGFFPVYVSSGTGSTAGDIYFYTSSSPVLARAVDSNKTSSIYNVDTGQGQRLSLESANESIKLFGDDLNNKITFQVRISEQNGNLLQLLDNTESNPGLFVSSTFLNLDGDVVGQADDTEVVAIRGIDVQDTTPQDKQILAYSAAQNAYVPSNPPASMRNVVRSNLTSGSQITLPNTPSDTSLVQITRNGVGQYQTTDYTISGNQINFIRSFGASNIPETIRIIYPSV